MAISHILAERMRSDFLKNDISILLIFRNTLYLDELSLHFIELSGKYILIKGERIKLRLLLTLFLEFPLTRVIA